jgi:flagellar basal-body rod protein FlgB
MEASMAISLDNYFALQQRILQVRNQKTEVMASNLANADTPGYKAQDIDFNEAMEAASHMRSHSLKRTHDKHFEVTMVSNNELKYRIPTQPDTGDGNTVDVQLERNLFMENSMRYQATTQFLNGKISGMKKALGAGGGR